MSGLPRWTRAATRLLRRNRVERDVDAELQFHLDMAARENEETGLTPPEARRRARVAFGSEDLVREQARDALGITPWSNQAQDLRLAIRSLSKNPVFTAVSVLLLALGIGLNTAILSVAVSAFLRALPFPDSHRLYSMVGTIDKRGWSSAALGIPEIVDHERRSPDLGEVGIYSGAAVNLFDGGRGERVEASFVNSAYFRLLGAEAQRGRTFVPAEDEGPGGHPVAILSDGMWRQRFGARPDIVGRTIELTDGPFTVVGVMPAEFRGLLSRWREVDVWLPLTMGQTFFGSNMFENRRHRVYAGVVRLPDGRDIGSVRQQVHAAAAALREEYPTENRDRGVRLEPLREFFYGSSSGWVIVLYAGAAVVLLICCANLLSLALVRSAARRREIGLRSALGASRWRLARQFLTESFLLALCGSVLGMAAAAGATRLIVASFDLRLPTFTRVGVDPPVLALATAIAFVAMLGFGLYPALRYSGVDPRDALGDSWKSVGVSAASRRSWSLLLSVEAALAVVLLVGAGLAAKSLQRLAATPVGFATSDLLTMRMDLRGSRVAEPERSARFAEAVTGQLAGIPGVDGAAVWAPSMIGRAGWHEDVTAAGLDASAPENRLLVQRLHVTPGALEAVGIPLLRGRDFTWGDDGKRGPPVVIVGRKLAERLWPDAEAVGQRVIIAGNFEVTVIGVAGEAKHRGRRATGNTVGGDLYFPYAQWPQSSISLLVRAHGDSSTLAPIVTSEIGNLVPESPVFDVVVMSDRLRAAESVPRFIATLMATYAGVAMLLATIGTYGVVAFTVGRRRNEIALRAAIGARRGELLWMVFRQGVAPITTGVAVGLVLALAVARFARSLWFGVSATDPVIYVSVGLLLLGVSAIACYLPARRAAALDPMRVLRCD